MGLSGSKPQSEIFPLMIATRLPIGLLNGKGFHPECGATGLDAALDLEESLVFESEGAEFAAPDTTGVHCDITFLDT